MFSRYVALIAVALAFPVAVHALDLNFDWKHARDLGKQPMVVTQYSTLGATGSARFYRLEVSEATTYQIDLDIDGALKNSFHPRVVLYRPDTVTAGPALPMEQPPSTVAAVYSTSEQVLQHEGPWLSLVNRRFHTTLNFETAGTYYLAVYNAGTLGGPYRLTLIAGDHDLSPWQTTARWLKTTIWVGAQWWNIVVPLLAAVIAGVFWFVIHRLPHPKKRYVRR